MTKKECLSIVRSIDGWLSEREASLLYTLASKIPVDGEIVEVGSFKGKSTIALAAGLQNSRKAGIVWAIDPHKGVIQSEQKSTYGETYQSFLRNVKAANLENFVHPVVATSKNAVKGWKRPIRLLFLDGLHDYEHTKEDYRLWGAWVVKRGCIAFHDGFCGEIGVWKVINEHLFNRKDIVEIGVAGSILYVVLGTPTVLSKLSIQRRKRIIRIANWIHRKRIPWLAKKFGIHVIIRLALLTKYTAHALKK